VPSAPAQEHTAPAPGDDEVTPQHAIAETHGAEHSFRNALGIILGGTCENEEKDTFFTFGVEYERFIGRRFGVVLGVEYLTEVEAVVLVAPFVYRHGSGWRLLTGPGLELKTRRPHLERKHEGEHELAGDLADRLAGRKENLFLWRFGVAHNFEIGARYALAPSVAIDLVREDGHWVEAVVFAVSFGFDF